MSAANAALHTVKDIVRPTPKDDWFSAAVCSDGSYGIEEGLICSFPLINGEAGWEVVTGVKLDDFAKQKIDATVSELKQERDTVKDLLK